MNKPFGRLLEPRDGSATDGQPAESPETPVEPMLTGLIAEHLQRRWAQEEPGEKCFDHGELTMARLLAFIDGTATDADKREVRTSPTPVPPVPVRFREDAGGGRGRRRVQRSKEDRRSPCATGSRLHPSCVITSVAPDRSCSQAMR